MEYKDIILSKQGEIVFLTLNRPEKANALSINMIAEMTDAVSKISIDESIKVIILRANGKHFCAGHYLAEMVDQGMKEYKEIFDNCGKLMRLLHETPQPVIAQVQGIATAAGCQLVAWSDLAVAEQGAKFGTPGVKIGLFCSTPMVAITRAIGRKAAMEMLLTGRLFTASEALTLGLINKISKTENLAYETEEFAKQIAKASGFVLGIGKKAFYAQIDLPDYKAFEYAQHTIALNTLAQDAQNGIKAFLEKKKPEWKNR